MRPRIVGLSVLGAGVAAALAVWATRSRLPEPPRCPANPDGWRTLPAGVRVEQISGTSSDAWAAGFYSDDIPGGYRHGTTFHFDGCAWKEHAVPAELGGRIPTALWAAGGEVWMGLARWHGSSDFRQCESAVVRRRGDRWETVSSYPGAAFSMPAVRYVGGTGPTDVWLRWDMPCGASRPDAALLHWDGQRLRTVRVKELDDRVIVLWVGGPGLVFAGGYDGKIARFDGGSWQVQKIDGVGFLQGIGGAGPQDVWASTSTPGTLLHWNGRSWSRADSPEPEVGPGPYPYLLAGTPGATFAVRPDSSVLLRRRDDWQRLLTLSKTWGSPSFRSATMVTGAWATGPRDLWIRATRGDRPWLMRWTGEWRAGGPSPAEDLLALWWDGAALWSAASHGLTPDPGNVGSLRRLEGGQWKVSARLPKVPTRLWGTSPSDVWAVGIDGSAWHWDGSRWSARPTGVTDDLFALWGSGPGDVWAGGRHGTLVNWDGRSWKRWSTLGVAGNHDVLALWGSGADDIWAATGYGLLHFDGRGWSETSRRGEAMTGVWGRGRDDVWAVGRRYHSEPNPYGGYREIPSPLVLHWDGRQWSETKIMGAVAQPSYLAGVSGSPSGDAWAWGPKGGLVHLVNGEWITADSRTEADLADVRLDGAGTLWLAGAEGTLRSHPAPRR